MLLAAIGLPLVFLYSFREDIQLYFYKRKWAKQTPEEREADFQKEKARYNRTMAIRYLKRGYDLDL